MGGLTGLATYKLVMLEWHGPEKAFGRELNEGENMVPSVVPGLVTLLLLVAGAYLVVSAFPR